MNWGLVARRRLREIDMRPAELARRTGYSRQYIGELLRGKRRWNEDAIETVFGVLGLRIEIVAEGVADDKQIAV